MASPEGGAPAPDIAPQIRIVRGQRVLLDTDLAALYDVTTKRLDEQVLRDQRRFPEDFCFSMPLAFTEHGAIMAATILNSPPAVQMSVYVVRAFRSTRRSWV